MPGSDLVEESAPSSAAAVISSKKPLQHERILKVISDGSPEELEAEVRSSQKFLVHLKKPMVELVEQHKDAKHWVQQIGKMSVVMGCENVY